jgi:hypothetical protein
MYNVGTSQPRNLIVSIALQRGRGRKQTLLFKITSMYAFIRKLNLHILKFYMQVTMVALKKKPPATNFSDHHTISIIAHTAKIAAKILRKRIEKKIEDVLGEDQFGFRRGKGTRDAIGMLKIISERTLEIDEELSVCFID